MIVQASNNSHDYKLIFSTIYSLIYLYFLNIYVHTKYVRIHLYIRFLYHVSDFKKLYYELRYELNHKWLWNDAIIRMPFIMGSSIVIDWILYLMIIILSNSFVTENLKTRPTDTSETLPKDRSYTEDMQKCFSVVIDPQLFMVCPYMVDSLLIYLGNYWSNWFVLDICCVSQQDTTFVSFDQSQG